MMNKISPFTKPDMSLMTFAQVLKLKREQKRLTIKEVVEKSGASAYASYERGDSMPTEKSLLKLVDFFRLNEEEVKLCVPFNRKEQAMKNHRQKSIFESKPRIDSLINEIDVIVSKLNDMDERGTYAKKLKVDSIEALRQARELLLDVVIIDKLI